MVFRLCKVVKSGHENKGAGFYGVLECGHKVHRGAKIKIKREMVCLDCPQQWSEKYSSCVVCHKTKRPHSSKGRCDYCLGCVLRPRKDWSNCAKNRRLHVNDFLFDKWNEKSAYMLGVIYTDGCISPDKNKNWIKITLSKKDKVWLKELAKIMGYTGSLREQKIEDKWGERWSVTLRFSSKRIIKRLRKLKAKNPKVVDLVPDKWFSHFIRGAFDGDGSVYFSNNDDLRVNFAGVKLFLEKVRRRLHVLVGTSNRMKIHTKPNTKTGRSLVYANEDSIRLFKYWYANASFCLKRKYNRFLRKVGALRPT